MGLNTTDKKEWQAMLGKRIDTAIERIWAAEPVLKDEIERQSLLDARESLGVTQIYADLDELEKQKKDLEQAKKRKEWELAAILLGKDPTVVESVGYYERNEMDSAVERRQVLTREELMQQHPEAKKVLELEAERDNLNETIWLATTVSQVKEFWTAVNERCQIEPRQLEEAALKIKGPGLQDHPPVESK